MDLFHEISKRVLQALAQEVPQDLLAQQQAQIRDHLAPSRDPAQADLVSTVALTLARPLRQNPRALAQSLAARLTSDPWIAAATVGGPGFLNLRLAPDLWHDLVAHIIATPDYGQRTPTSTKTQITGWICDKRPLNAARTEAFVRALTRLNRFAGHDATWTIRDTLGGAVPSELGVDATRITPGDWPRDTSGLNLFQITRPDGTTIDGPLGLTTGPQDLDLGALIDLLGRDLLTWGLLARQASAPVKIDPPGLRDATIHNPIFAIQYGLVKARHAAEFGTEDTDFTAKGAQLLPRLLAQWPYEVQKATEFHDPYGITLYLASLARAYVDCVNPPRNTPQEKAPLARAVTVVISAGLGILGITPAKELR